MKSNQLTVINENTFIGLNNLYLLNLEDNKLISLAFKMYHDGLSLKHGNGTDKKKSENLLESLSSNLDTQRDTVAASTTSSNSDYNSELRITLESQQQTQHF